MNEEAKKAFEFIKDLINWDVRQDLCPNKEECEKLEIVLNLIEKLQKENEELREYNAKFIAVQKVKDKEEQDIENTIKVLQELLEGRE